MSVKSSIECETNKIVKLRKWQLPNKFKTIGIAIAVISFLSLIVNKLSYDDLEYKQVVRYGMIVGVLIISISKEKIEDELIEKLRLQSYMFAFIFGVVMSILIPFLDYFIDIIRKGEAIFGSAGDFQILWMLLVIQVIYFELLKKSHC